MVQGRIVWGSGKTLFEGKPKVDSTTKQPRLGKDGRQLIEYGFGLAVNKAIITQENMAPGRPAEFYAAMFSEAMSLFPGAQAVPKQFAMKTKDGDIDADDKGIPYSQRTGYAGHIVLACTTTIPIKWFRFDPQTNQNYIVEEGIKVGDYVNVQLQIKAHPAIGQSKAGLYLNPLAVQFVGYGEAIINAPSGDQIFGAGAPQLPPGASAQPVAPTGGFLMAPPQAPQAPQMPATPQFAPQAPAQAPVAPEPHYGVVPQQFQPPVQQAPAMPPMGNAQPAISPPQAPGFAPPAFPSNGMPPMPGYPQR